MQSGELSGRMFSHCKMTSVIKYDESWADCGPFCVSSVPRELPPSCSYVFGFLPTCDESNYQSFKEAICPFAEWDARTRMLSLAGYSGHHQGRGFQIVDCN